VDRYNTKEIARRDNKARVLFRNDRVPRASPRVRSRRSGRGHRHLPLNGARPNRVGQKVRSLKEARARSPQFQFVRRRSPGTRRVAAEVPERRSLALVVDLGSQGIRARRSALRRKETCGRALVRRPFGCPETRAQQALIRAA